jgi:hypothetical protein
MKRHRQDSGFAMLLVFLMAACIAITLYMELPRAAFEAERQHELLLVDRGNQFKRAIQVFTTDTVNNPTGRYPASIDELENFNNHRYLRRKYKDPMTGKDEWRLIHINGGVLTDSVTTQANPAANGQSGAAAPAGPAYISTQAFMDSSDPNGTRGGGAARAMRGRPSDSQLPGATGDAGATPGGTPGSQGSYFGAPTPGAPPGSGQPGQPGAPNQAGIPGIPGVVPGTPGLPGTPSTGAAASQPCTVYIGSCPQTTPSGQSGQPGQQGQMGVPGQAGMPGGAGMPGQPGMPQGGQANPAASAATSLINNLLTTPRPGGMPTAMPGSTIGGGIAGVASKYEAEGIMVINDRTAINEWEYIFDKSKYRPPPNPVSGAVGTPLAPMQGGSTGTPIGSQPGTGTGTTPSTTGK